MTAADSPSGRCDHKDMGSEHGQTLAHTRRPSSRHLHASLDARLQSHRFRQRRQIHPSLVRSDRQDAPSATNRSLLLRLLPRILPERQHARLRLLRRGPLPLGRPNPAAHALPPGALRSHRRRRFRSRRHPHRELLQRRIDPIVGHSYGTMSTDTRSRRQRRRHERLFRAQREIHPRMDPRLEHPPVELCRRSLHENLSRPHQRKV